MGLIWEDEEEPEKKTRGESDIAKEDLVVGCVESHFLDSGAYTLWTRAEEWAKEKGKKETDFYETQEHWSYLDAYANFIKENQVAIDLYANVDAIGFPEITWRNQQYLEEKYGLRPVPVVHYRTDLKWLEHYLKRGYDLIGLGGLVGSTAEDHCRGWIDSCFELVCDTPDRLPKVKIHGFGVTTYELLIRYPWYCMTREHHEVLTRSGWKGVDTLSLGEEILAYDNGSMTWQPILELPKFDVINVDLIHLRNKKIKGVEAYVTWNHRWRVADRDNNTSFKWKETWELGNTHVIPRVGEYVDVPTEKLHSDDFVELVAWYWTEGTLNNRPRYKTPSVRIYQSEKANPHKTQRIRELLKRLDEKSCEGAPTTRDGLVGFELYGNACKKLLQLMPTKEKIIPYDFILSLTKDQLELFVDVSVSADGHRHQMVASERFDACLRQKDRRNIDQFRLACILAGYTTSEITTSGGFPEIRLCRTPHTKFAWVKVMEKEVIRYTGQLWCVRVKSGAFFTRCNGCVYVTGNSVDSTSWTKIGAFGGILAPHKRKGKWDFSEQPYLMKVSEESPTRKERGKHILTMTPQEKAIVQEWLDYIGIKLGKRDENGEVVEYGVVTRHTERRAANLLFFEELRKWLPPYPFPFYSRRRKGFGIC